MDVTPPSIDYQVETMNGLSEKQESMYTSEGPGDPWCNSAQAQSLRSRITSILDQGDINVRAQGDFVLPPT